MPRKLRVQAADVTYHVTMRGVDGCAIVRDRRDHERFETFLAETCSRFGVRCLAFCRMGNHFHLLLHTTEENISSAIQYLAGRYAQTFNRRHGRTGHLFQGRFHSVIVATEAHLLQLIRYLALNPVKAGLCRSPADWRHGSYITHLGRGPRRPFLDYELLSLFAPTRALARRRLQSFVEDEPP